MLTMVGLLMIGLFMASLAAWCIVPMMWSQGKIRWVLREHYPPNSWGFIDILVALVIFVVVQVFATAIGLGLGVATLEDLAWNVPQPAHHSTLATIGTSWESDDPPSLEPPSDTLDEKKSDVEDPAKLSRRMTLTTLVLSGNLLVVALVTAWISLRTQVSPARVGWSLRDPAKDILLAIGALILFAPIVYLTMGFVSQLFKQEYEHPILEMIRANPWMIGFAFWMAVIVAPITEEFAFRVLLQGFLESLAIGKFQFTEFLLGRRDVPSTVSPELALDGAIHSTAETVAIARPGEFLNSSSQVSQRDAWTEAYASKGTIIPTLEPSSTLEANHAPAVPVFPIGSVRSWWPILLTGILFGLIHFDYGMSWIPLSLLGIVLGWLYHLTHRIWPCILLHMGFNLISMLAMSASVLSGK